MYLRNLDRVKKNMQEVELASGNGSVFTFYSIGSSIRGTQSVSLGDVYLEGSSGFCTDWWLGEGPWLALDNINHTRILPASFLTKLLVSALGLQCFS